MSPASCGPEWERVIFNGVIFLNWVPILSIEERLFAQAPGQIGFVFAECGELSYLVLSMQKEINH